MFRAEIDPARICLEGGVSDLDVRNDGGAKSDPAPLSVSRWLSLYLTGIDPNRVGLEGETSDFDVRNTGGVGTELMIPSSEKSLVAVVRGETESTHVVIAGTESPDARKGEDGLLLGALSLKLTLFIPSITDCALERISLIESHVSLGGSDEASIRLGELGIELWLSSRDGTSGGVSCEACELWRVGIDGATEEGLLQLLAASAGCPEDTGQRLWLSDESVSSDTEGNGSFRDFLAYLRLLATTLDARIGLSLEALCRCHFVSSIMARPLFSHELRFSKAFSKNSSLDEP